MRRISKRKHREKIRLVTLNFIFIILCFVTFDPHFLYAVRFLQRPRRRIIRESTFLPENPTLENYRAILLDEPFLLWLKNSLILSVGTITISMICAVPAAYAVSRWRFPAGAGY